MNIPDKITHLPNEIWEEITGYLTRAELVNLSCVSRDIKQLCDSDHRWKRFVEKRQLPCPNAGTWKERAFSYCRHHNEIFSRLLKACFRQEIYSPFQIPSEVQANLFLAKRYVAKQMHEQKWNMTNELRRRFSQYMQYGDPLSLDDIQVLLEGGARFANDFSLLLPKFLQSIEDTGVAEERLNALLDRAGHPGPRKYDISLVEFLRVLHRWKGRFADMSEDALAQLTEAGKKACSSVDVFMAFPFTKNVPSIPIDFPKYREFFASVCRRCPIAILDVPEDIDDYVPLVLDAIEGNAAVFDRVDENVRTSPDFLRRAVKRNGLVLPRYAREPKDISDSAFYEELAMLALGKSGQVASGIVWDAISDYREFVTRAVDTMIQEGRCNDIGVILKVIDPTRVDNYQALVEKAVRAYPRSIRGVRENFVNNYRELLKSAVARDATLIRWYKDFDPEEYSIYATEAVRLNARMIRFLDRDRLGLDYYRRLVLVALGQNGMLLMNLGEFAEDAEVVAAAVKQDPRAIEYACDRFKTDLTPLLRTCVHYEDAEQLFLARWCLKKELSREQVDAGFTAIARMAAKEDDCPKGEVERLLGRIGDSEFRESVRQTLAL